MDILGDIEDYIKKYKLKYQKEARNGDVYFTLTHLDINLYADGSGEISIFSLSRKSTNPLFNKYFEAIKLSEIKEIEQLLLAYVQKRIYEAEDPVWGETVVIKRIDGTYALPMDDSISTIHSGVLHVYNPKIFAENS